MTCFHHYENNEYIEQLWASYVVALLQCIMFSGTNNNLRNILSVLFSRVDSLLYNLIALKKKGEEYKNLIIIETVYIYYTLTISFIGQDANNKLMRRNHASLRL